MKDILVEFTDYGAIIHKDSSVILSKKDLPYCFFNPDLSKVSGVSPSYWICNSDNEIVPASQEEKKRRDEYHKGKPSENTVSLKQTMDLMRQEISEDIEASIKEVKENIDEVKGNCYSSINETNLKFEDKISELEDQLFQMEVSKEMLYLDISEKAKEIKYLKIGLILSVLLTTILRLV